MGNSFEYHYKLHNPAVRYSYNKYSQTHDYSGNWDIDGDGIPDRIFFIGNGGAHVYFHLVIILSTWNEIRDFPWIDSDFPALGDVSEFKKSFHKKEGFIGFAIDKSPKGTNTINLCLDDHDIPAELKKRGITSRYLSVSYENGKLRVSNFKNKETGH